ncbi:MAG TPA: DUF3108 domain-containing protein [Nitrospirales bacterium]|nr:DUF3108 domain-containing protein [Nitrospirales bacterium]
MRRIPSILLACSVVLLPAVGSSDERPHVRPAFVQGERLSYAVSYLGLRAGSLTMEVTGRHDRDGRPVYRFMTVAKSQDPVTRFFPVHDEAESIVDAETLAPQHVRLQKHEGKSRSKIDVTFQHRDGTAVTIKDGEMNRLSIPLETQQTFSVVYYVRSLRSLALGTSGALTVQHETKHYPMQFVVDKVEDVAGPWGRRSALRISVALPASRLWRKPGKIQVWVTTDPSHVPLKVTATMLVGMLVAELTDTARPPRLDN